jgi:hypothetical protein
VEKGHKKPACAVRPAFQVRGVSDGAARRAPFSMAVAAEASHSSTLGVADAGAMRSGGVEIARLYYRLGYVYAPGGRSAPVRQAPGVYARRPRAAPRRGCLTEEIPR